MTAEKFILKILNRKFPFVVDVKDSIYNDSEYFNVFNIYVDYNKLKEYAQIPDEYLDGMNIIMGSYKKKYNENYHLHHLSSILDDSSPVELDNRLNNIDKHIAHLLKTLGESYIPISLLKGGKNYINLDVYFFV
jgi:hypothetical protein